MALERNTLEQALKSVSLLQQEWSCFPKKTFSLIEFTEASSTLASWYNCNTDSQRGDPGERHFRSSHEIHVTKLRLSAKGTLQRKTVSPVEIGGDRFGASDVKRWRGGKKGHTVRFCQRLHLTEKCMCRE